MGCAASSESGEAEAPRPVALEKQQAPQPPRQLEWEINADLSWTESIRKLYSDAVEAGTINEFRTNYQKILIDHAAEWVAKQYPESTRRGASENIGNDGPFDTCFGHYPHLHRQILCLDDKFTGIVHTGTLIVALPLNDKGEFPEPGASTNTPEVESAKRMMQEMFGKMLTHKGFGLAVFQIIMGADLFTCNLANETSEPLVNQLIAPPTKGQKAANDEMVRTMKMLRGFCGCRPASLMLEISAYSTSEYPGTTVWDGGELPFLVGGKQYPFPTRLLVIRDFKQMTAGADKNARHYKVITPMTRENDTPIILLRQKGTLNDFSGAVCIALQVALEPKAAWPKYGVYSKNAAFHAAQMELLRYAQKLYKEGKIQHCTFCVTMGVDRAQYKFVGPVRKLKHELGPTKEEPDSEAIKDEEPFDDSLEAWGVKLEEQAPHTLWNSESHFQAMKKQMLESAKQNPERAQQIAMMAGITSAKTFMKINFPGCEVSDEGGFPFMMNGEEHIICDSRLILCKDPKQEPKSIVAAMHVVPKVMHEAYGWLDTKEMKAAEIGLLELMKRLYQQGKISEVDCMAQVMFGVDASYYRFVDGEKFVDYSEEEEKRFKWQPEAGDLADIDI